MLIEFAFNMTTEEEFARVVAAASKTCKNLEIPISGSETKKDPGQQCKTVMDRFLTTSSEAVASWSAKEINGFVLPTLDTFRRPMSIGVDGFCLGVHFFAQKS